MAYHIDTIIARKILNSDLAKNVGPSYQLRKLTEAAEEYALRDVNAWKHWFFDISEGTRVRCVITMSDMKNAGVQPYVSWPAQSYVRGSDAVQQLEFVRRVASLCEEISGELANYYK